MPIDVVRAAYQRVCRESERVRWIAAAVLAGWFLTLLIFTARGRSFWHDEVYTILTAQLPIGELWRANLDGVDLSPPLNTILTRAVHAVSGMGPIATRVPSMAGLLTSVVLLTLTVGRRTNPFIGMSAALLLFSTPAWSYAVEARGYGLSLGWFALALSAWTEAAAARRPRFHWVVMGVALAAGLWTHYYAILVFFPIVTGEAVRQRVNRAFQAAPWIAIGCAVAAVLPLWKLIAVASAHRATFWAHPDNETIASVYAYVLKDLTGYTVVAAAIALLIVIELVRRWQTGRSSRRLAPHDLAAIVACLTIPAAALLLGNIIHVFTTRYLVFATVGIAFALPQIIWWLTPDTGLADVMLVVALAWPIGAFSHQLVRDPPRWSTQADDHPLLIEWLKRPEPIALTGGVEYLGLWYSLPSSMRPRAVYLADPVDQLRSEGSDTVDRGYLALSHWTPVPVALVDDFVRARPTFWLYSFDAHWAEQRLHELKATMTEIVRESNGQGTIYKVEVPTGRHK